MRVSRPDRPFVADAKAVAAVIEAGVQSSGTGSGAVFDAATAAASDLDFELIDHFNGVEDMYARVLRCPYPAERPTAAVWAEVLRDERDSLLARELKLCTDGTGGPEVTICRKHNAPTLDLEAHIWHACRPPQADVEDSSTLQVVWWVKVLREDPLRAVRALRFSATLRFRLHPAFWLAAPFVIGDGDAWAKVSSSREC